MASLRFTNHDDDTLAAGAGAKDDGESTGGTEVYGARFLETLRELTNEELRPRRPTTALPGEALQHVPEAPIRLESS